MQSDNQNSRKTAMEVIFAVILGIFAIILFLDFTKKNNEQIIEQNENYVQDATLQVAKRLDDVFAAARDSVMTMAHLYGDSLELPSVTTQELMEMQENSPFDYIEFVDKDGLNINAQGDTLDVSHRESYIEGMKGNSGYFVVCNSEIEEALLIFYAPLHCKGEIIGVLKGVYREQKLKELLSTEFFDVQAKNYLCQGDGTVIISTGTENAPKNILEALPDTMKVSEEQKAQIKKTFTERASYGYQYQGSQGIGNAYIIGISNCDMILVQTFPSAVTSHMIDKANAVSAKLEIWLIAGFGIYIAYLLWAGRKVKKQLMTENQEMSQIVSEVTQLFERFVIVDLEKETYKYVKDMEKGLPTEGSYSDLISYFAPLYVEETDDLDMPKAMTKEYIREHLGKDTPFIQYEYRIQRESMRWENMSILCLQRQNGVPTHVLVVIQDVTALKENELRNRMALREAFEAADEANRAKSEFLSKMSHDIRTPMNAIMGMTAVAAMHIDDKERLFDCLNKITLSSRHLLALINDVLDMSKIESGKVTLSMEEFEISQAVESLLAIVHPQIQAKNQDLKVNVSNITHEGVIGDQLRLQQIFVNIMGNAVKFTPEGGTITFNIHEKPSHIQGSGCYEFVFQDTGIGMKPEFIEKIYEPFSRAEDAGRQNIEGTGLGMSIAKNIVRMMNGDIQIESRPGEGSKFTVTVYLKLQDVEEPQTECLKELRVLVADDEQDACENTCEILNSIGMCADGVLSGDEAVRTLQAASEMAQEYAVVILDWKMPGKCGVETTKEIRNKLGNDVPIIILSAYDWSSIEQEAREAGVNAFIAKPLFKSRLIYVLKSVIMNQEEEKSSDIDTFVQSDYSGKKILLVEDNALNIEIAEELLSYINIEVEKARDGQQAVDIIRSRPQNYFDMVLMDIQMPVMNGYQAAREIRSSDREDLKTIPIIAMSADAFSDDIHKAAMSGMNDHVAKPIELPKLMAALQKWIR